MRTARPANINLPSKKFAKYNIIPYLCHHKPKNNSIMTALEVNSELFYTMGQLASDEGLMK